ncbi:putative transcriptional elongation factor Iws1 [Xylona heveae TC161]|uniref:Putative transcriptional elongation factor Iws1 n=1 Tax=Xylona heveae (strain CBS 132557 / TC161) TaxID=1328760 RepID=A0A165AKI1_XYLHT|nr:putative transcriptional elongation factor Iws1 [Xylona heveae TC161]KZF20636.1 putative transcriptional elongation factor Iws1 [Xylona heveae TC161]
MSSASDSRPVSPIPEAGHDPQDTALDYEDKDSPAPPLADPHQDMDAVEDQDQNAVDDAQDDALSDNESALSEVDEAQFEDFDPANIAIDDRPAIAVDESNVALLGRHKRKRDDGLDGESGKKKKKEGKREKKSRQRRGEDDGFSGGEEVEGKRSRKTKEVKERKERARARRPSVEDESALTPEERRKRALDKAMDEALRNPNRRRRKADGIDLEAMADAEIEDVRRRMAEAAKADTDARDAGRPAMHKLKMLPEVVALLNRNTLQHNIVDPDVNLLEAVRFFLEPLNDGSLPAYNIQRDLFAALAKLPINKDSLVASGIGKVVLFYTKSKRPEPGIKRQAERLLGEWTRPILKRTDDYRKRERAEASYDPTKLPSRAVPHISREQIAAEARQRMLAPVRNTNRARAETGTTTYTIAPVNVGPIHSAYARPMGASGEDAFRRMKARQMGKAGGRR